jgi:hypothetical protein
MGAPLTLWTLATELQRAALDAARSAGDAGAVDAHVQACAERRRVLTIQVSQSGPRLAVSVTTAPIGARSDLEIYQLLDVEHQDRGPT